jgi:hypothetical protein
MVYDPLSGNDATDNVKCEVTKLIDIAKSTELYMPHLSTNPTVPESFHFGKFDQRNRVVPKTKVNLD